MAEELRDIQNYSDYRKYLEERYRAFKSKDRHFSHRYISQKAGAHSSGWFSDILMGRQKLKSRHVAPLAIAFKLDARERSFLQVLVDLENAENQEQSSSAYERWFELKGVRQEIVAKENLKYFDHWYLPALRELMVLEGFRGDYAELAAKLNPPIRANQAKLALETLTRLGLLLPGLGGALPVLVKDATIRTPHWKRLQRAFMRLALPALDKFSKDERDFSALTLTFSRESLKKAGKEIEALRKRLLILSDRDKSKNRVYQCLFQVFPVSNPVENKG